MIKKITDNYNCLMEKGGYENVAEYVIRKKDQEMYLRKVNKLALNWFDDQRKYINNLESISWT